MAVLTPAPDGFGRALFEALAAMRHADGRAWSTVDLAGAVGVSANQVRQWVSGKAMPRGAALVRLGEVLGVDAAALTRGTLLDRDGAVDGVNHRLAGLRAMVEALGRELDAVRAHVAHLEAELARLDPEPLAGLAPTSAAHVEAAAARRRPAAPPLPTPMPARVADAG